MLDVINVVVALKKKSSRQTILRSFRSYPIFKVEVCLNEHEMKAALSRQNVDFLVVEYNMPTNGIFNFMDENRGLSWSMIQLILCTEDSDPLIRDKAKDYNFDGYLKIPFSGMEVQKELEPLIQDLSKDSSPDQFKLTTNKYLRSGRYQEACNFLAKTPIKDMNEDTMYKYAFSLGKTSKEEEAIRILQQMLKQTPENIQSIDLLSQLLSKTKKYKKAYEFAKQAVHLASNNPERIQLVTELAVRSTNFSDIMTYAKLVDQYKWNHHEVMVYTISGLIIQGIHCLNQDDPDEAFNCFLKAADLSQVSPKLKHLMQRALIEASKLKITDDLNFLIAEAFPDRDDPGFLLIQGMKNFHQKTYESAAVYFRKVCEHGKFSEFSYPHLMDTYLLRGEMDQAKKLVVTLKGRRDDKKILEILESKLKKAA